MARTALWKTIADTLTTEIGADHYAPGDKLPTEAELSQRFGVNRHTVRRALSEMSDRGLIHTRRGAGVFVASKPTDYPIGKRVRFHQNLEAAGRVPGRKILMSETRHASAKEAELLQIDSGEQVHAFETLAFADGQPIMLGRSIFPAARVPGLLEALRLNLSITKALKECGVADYTRASMRINAMLATATQASHLRIAENASILRTTSVSVDPKGHPIEFGTTWMAGDRVTLTFSPSTPEI
jgi:GntR family phosphonate transport system transcriptional regulator